VAEMLDEYLPYIVNDFKPWLSKKSIDKGANWGTELTNALTNAGAGIICLTPSNLAEPWILFEAGAIAKTVAAKTLACTLLIGLESIDLTGPLALFQATKPIREEMLHLVKTLNKALGKDALGETQVEKAFDALFWPKLEEKLSSLPPDGPAGRPHRTDRELLVELVDWVRSSADRSALTSVELIDHMVSISNRLAEIEASYNPDKYIFTTNMLDRGVRGKFVKLSSLGPANAYADQFKSDGEKIIDEALSQGDVAPGYAEAAKASGSETHLPSSSRVTRAKAAATLPIGLRAAARRAGIAAAPKARAKK
jgi:hypothetical protein